MSAMYCSRLEIRFTVIQVVQTASLRQELLG